MGDRIVYNDGFLDFDIKRALSIYNPMSATGKTYWPYYAMTAADFPTVCIFATKDKYERFLRSPWSAGDDSIYFFDRFDLFGTRELVDILEQRMDICSLLDYKSPLMFMGRRRRPERVLITRHGADKIEVKNDILL